MEGIQILHEIFRVVSRFPRNISCYIAENRLPLGQCIAGGQHIHSPSLSLLGGYWHKGGWGGGMGSQGRQPSRQGNKKCDKYVSRHPLNSWTCLGDYPNKPMYSFTAKITSSYLNYNSELWAQATTTTVATIGHRFKDTKHWRLSHYTDNYLQQLHFDSKEQTLYRTLASNRSHNTLSSCLLSQC